MKKYLTILAAAVIFTGALSGCKNDSAENFNNDSTEKIKIVTTIFPEYDWVKQILGEEADNAEVTLLLNNGTDMHSFQPTASDLVKVSDCDLFIYVGGESDTWVEGALKEAVNKDMKVINLMDTLGDVVKEEEIVEGMQEEENDHDEEEYGDIEYDEHVWLSLKNAELLCRSIAEELSLIDPDNSAVYDENTEEYINKLEALDNKYEEMAESSQNAVMLFGDRFPFRYLADDYDIYYYAAFPGCSAETEASFETITFLSGKMDELELKYIFTIEKSDEKIADTIIQNTQSKNQQILCLDSMQSTTLKDSENGVTYLSIMEANLEVLSKALN